MLSCKSSTRFRLMAQIKAQVTEAVYAWAAAMVIEMGYTYAKGTKPAWGKFFQAWEDGKIRLIPGNLEKGVDD